MNSILKLSPEHPLPEGYRKVIEKEIDYDYTFPAELAIPEKYKICYEVLDEIIADIFEVHHIEPIIYFRNVPKAKPKLIPSVSSKLYGDIKSSNNEFDKKLKAIS